MTKQDKKVGSDYTGEDFMQLVYSIPQINKYKPQAIKNSAFLQNALVQKYKNIYCGLSEEKLEYILKMYEIHN